MSAELKLAQRFHTLAQEYDNRPVVVSRGTVPSILRYLDCSEWAVRHVAAETILLLAQHPQNKEALCRENGFVETLVNTYRASETQDPKLFDLLGSVIEELRAVLEAGPSGGDVRPASESALNPPTVDNGSVRTVKNRPTRVRTGGTVSRSLKLHIGNLTAATHDELEELLQTIRGVISYTVDIPQRSVGIFLSAQTPTVTLSAVLCDGGFECEVLADDIVERSESDVHQQPTYRSSVAGSGHGSFLGGFFGGGSQGDWKRGLVLHGVEGNTLQSRLERQREEKARKHAQSRGAISGLFDSLKSWW